MNIPKSIQERTKFYADKLNKYPKLMPTEQIKIHIIDDF